MAHLNTQRLQNPIELGWLWMLNVKPPLPKPQANQDPQEAKALAQFEAEIEVRRDYYQVGGRW